MTNTKKRITAILLTLALILTMMPAMALTAFAADSDAAFGIAINDKEVNVTVTKQQLKANAVGPQVFPFASKQGGEWKYAVADGSSYEAVILEALQLGSTDKIADAAINWNNESGEAQGKFDLAVSDIQKAVDQFMLRDQNGNLITDAFNVDTITSAEAVAIPGAHDVTPIIAYKYHMYNSYEEATNALADGSWENGAKEEIRPFVGGNLSKETYLKKDGKVDPKAFNFSGKFSIVVSDPGYRLNVKNYNIVLPDQPEKLNVSMKTGDATKKLKSNVYTDVELEYLDAVWECTDADVVRIDEKGNITPLKAGTAKVTATAYKESGAVDKVIAEWNVTVQEPAKPAPAKPTSLKVKNVKKKTAKLSWKKAANAEGYVVYRSTKKNKGFKKIATVSGNSYKNKKLKKGKTYYYKVRSFNTVNGSKVYSGYSAVKKVKIKK